MPQISHSGLIVYNHRASLIFLRSLGNWFIFDLALEQDKPQTARDFLKQQMYVV